jgi:DNA-binding NtrC family response regulator
MKLNMKVAQRLLLVESEAPLRRSLENFLEIGGYTYQSCSMAQEALVLAQVLRPDVVIVEYRLPDASGVSVVEEVRRICPHVAAAVISEYDFQWVEKDLNRADIGYFLKKPFDPVELETVLSSSCSKAQAAMDSFRLENALSLIGNLSPSWNGSLVKC